MTAHRHIGSSGFSGVELLVTLFVAGIFLAAGYQLFNFVITDSGKARAESSASNAAYDYLRRYSDVAQTTCAPVTPVSQEPVTIEGVLDPLVTVSISCPQSDAPTISKIEVSVSYGQGSDATTVMHATYVDKSKGSL